MVASREEVARKLFGDYVEMYDSELYETALHYERTTKQKGCQNGALSYMGVEVFQLYLLSADENGAVDLDPARIAEETGRALNSVYAALKRLCSAGALIQDGKAYRVNLSWSPK